MLVVYYLYMYLHVAGHVHVFTCNWTSQFLISSYGTPLAQRASCFPLHSSLFGAVNYDNIGINSINSFVNWLKMYSQ